jgi:nitroreductase
MDIPFSRWYPAIEKRRSRRQFDTSRLVEPDKLSALDTVCRQFMPFTGARSCLVTDSARGIFRGIVGSYGKIKDAPVFIAFIGNMDSPSVQEEVGYTGEGVILEATALGLNTCWVGGFFRPESVASMVEIKSNERVLAVTPVGYSRRTESLEEKLMTGFGRHHQRLPVSRLMSKPGLDKLPEWVGASLQAARLAPSAVNRQPWAFAVGNDNITVYVRTGGPEFTVSKRLDCGIAMLHIETAAMSFGVRGEWHFLQAPQVARFNHGVEGLIIEG